MSQPTFAKCANYGCENLAEAPFPCCDSACGYERKQDQWKLQSYQEGKTEWHDPFFSLKNWTINKLEYYARN